MFNVNVHESSEGNVWKYVFENETAIAEAVLYRYGSFAERTVICCSVQSGCPIGCTFCGTGRNFVRNLTAEEIVYQVRTVLADKGIIESSAECAKFQIMFMSMGEPMLNWPNVERAIFILEDQFPNAQLLLSTMGVDNDRTFSDIIATSRAVPNLGLQFSIHKADEDARNTLIPFRNKMSLRKIRDAGLAWRMATGRNVYLNYCVDGTNTQESDIARLMDMFSPAAFNFTFSVVCSAYETMKDAGYRNLTHISSVVERFLSAGYNTRMFDPAGQDDIGGGCGQLWYVQEWLSRGGAA